MCGLPNTVTYLSHEILKYQPEICLKQKNININDELLLITDNTNKRIQAEINDGEKITEHKNEFHTKFNKMQRWSIIWVESVWNKRTYRELSMKYGVSPQTIRKYICYDSFDEMTD